MVLQSGSLPALLKHASDYVQALLGTPIAAVRPLQMPTLPMYLISQYTFHSASLLSVPCVLITPKPGSAISANAYAKHKVVISRGAGIREIVLVVDHLDARTARSFITHQAAFIVPGAQLYLPDFALHFRARRRHAKTARESLSPTAQLIVLAHLHGQTVSGATASRLALRYGLSKMGMSRAVAELSDHQLIKVTQRGRENIIEAPADRRAFWDHAQPYLRSPIRKTRILETAPRPAPALLAGETALSHYSALIEPSRMTYAVADTMWKSLQGQYGPELDAVADEDTIAVETWSYDPRALSDGDAVDRLSLWLALHDHPDERVARAAEVMLEEFPF